MLKNIFYTTSLYLFSSILHTYGQDSTISTRQYTLKELSELTILTGSIKVESREYAPSNITIITSQMIKERGYQTLIDVCQDIPGFDFQTFNDGGGEYSTFNLHRGLGDIGNSEILIMIDGIVQNQISYNWSLLWTYESMFIDIDNIEIVQGPGSVMYGAQAFSGVINIITKKKFNGVIAKTFLGTDNSKGGDIFFGRQFFKKIHFNIAYHNYQSNGDKGLNRYDPGGYFSNNLYPSIILADYDNNGDFIINQNNPEGGKLIPSGFNTYQNSFALRTGITYKNTILTYFVSDSKRGYASEITPFEYNITNNDVISHYRSNHLSLSNQKEIIDNIKLFSNIVVRGTHILPDGGFMYLYQFPSLPKSYASYSYQGYIEEKIILDFNLKNQVVLGYKGMISSKTERIVSLDGKLISKQKTNSSWDKAVAGNGIYQSETYPVFFVKESAAYLLWDRQWYSSISSSLGIRYDYSTEFKSILNPRFAVDFNPSSLFGIKYMFGTAFRQPTIFELSSEFRGNPHLNPQKIATHELETYSRLFDKSIYFKLNLFHSTIFQPIGKVPDNNKLAGERYENINNNSICGLSASLSGKINKQISIYTNYNLLLGLGADTVSFYYIDHTARHKINAGINFNLFNNTLVSDLRMNYVGKRKAPITNTWIQTYENGYAPSYIKFNASLIYKYSKKFAMQLVVNNIFNEQFYGIGHESGSSFIDEYDYIDNVNPTGHIPAYHPQPGRTFLLNIILNLNINE